MTQKIKRILSKNFYTGYSGYKGTSLDQTECELYDDIPTPSVKELTLQVLAGGQIAEQKRRAAYYDTDKDIDPDDIDEIDAGTGAEEFDYVQAYNNIREQNIKYFKMRQERLAREQAEQKEKEQQNPEPNKQDE